GVPFNPAPFSTVFTGRTAAGVLSEIDVGFKLTDGRAAPLFFNGFASPGAEPLPAHALFGYTTARSDYYGLGLADAYNRAAEMKSLLKPEARGAINDAELAPRELFSRYGTHIISSFTQGGRFDAYYIYRGPREITEDAFRAAINAAFTYMTATGEVALRGEHAQILEDTVITLGFTGSEGVFAGQTPLREARSRFSVWYENLTLDNCAISKLDRLIPIWELADGEARRAELQEAYLAALDGYTQDVKETHGPQETYISELVLYAGTNETVIKRALRSRGYKVLDTNLNRTRLTYDWVLHLEGRGVVHAYSARTETGSLPTRRAADFIRENTVGLRKGITRLAFREYIYLGYKTTTDPSQAITDILGATGLQPGGSHVFNDIEYITLDRDCNAYYPPNPIGILPEDQFGDFVFDTGAVSVITLHYTKDPAAGAPIRELSAASRYRSTHYISLPTVYAPFSTPALSGEHGWSIVLNADTGEMQDFDGGIPQPLQVYYDAGLINGGSDASNLGRYVTVWFRR
ncbi:MAG: hypothetical protein FWG93_05590, partial [Oscillospiraceae bacterium]|nr:hypothetical protein [Oscillospiraceae bacterium]